MKKKLLVVGIATMMLLSACGGKDSSKLPSEKAISVGKRAVEAGEKYLDGAYEYDEINSILEDLSNQLEYTSDDDDREKNPHHAQDFGVQADISILGGKILNDYYHGDAETYDSVREQIDKIKKDIGE